MKRHMCKQCNTAYTYCRGCLLSPISYKEHGFCSAACKEAFKNKIEEVVREEDVEVVITDRDISTSE